MTETKAPFALTEQAPRSTSPPVTAMWGRERYVFLAGYALFALFFVLFAGEGDVWQINYVANFVARGHIDVYRYFAQTGPLEHINTVMPPLYYAMEGLYLKVLTLLHINPVTTSPKWMFRELFGHLDRAHLWPGLFVLKVPNLIALGIGFYLMRKLVMRTGGDWRVGAVLWLASPFLVSTSLMQGQNDLLPAVVTLGALVLYRRESSVWTMLLLGVAAGLKSYTLILIPVTALLLSRRSLIRAIWLGLISAAPVALIFGPFLSHDMIFRVFHAHDSGSLLSGFQVLQREVFYWPAVYVSILIVAWLLSKDDVDTTRLATMWLLTLLSIFVFSWWLPQWGVWLMPMAVFLATRDKWFLWAWLAASVVVMANNFFMLPGNMDGAMLFPLFGEHAHPTYGHIYLFKRVLSPSVSIIFQNTLYTLCTVAFAVLMVRTLQWLFRPNSVTRSTEEEAWVGSSLALKTALVAPAIMIAVVAVMVVQNVVPPPHHRSALGETFAGRQTGIVRAACGTGIEPGAGAFSIRVRQRPPGCSSEVAGPAAAGASD